MSDSDSELLSNNVFTFQNSNMIVSTKGANLTKNTTIGQSFCRNVMSSTMQMPRNFERSRYAESFSQKSMYRRETSPMSIASACDMRQRNFNNSFYPRGTGMSSQRSIYNGRGASPMSVRSIDSSVSVSAASIAMAFKNEHFSKQDVRMIKEAYTKFMKHRVRHKIEKRRKLKRFLKYNRRKSGYDSGELGSDSSLSNDDCRSNRTTNYKENMSSCRSTRTDILSDFRKNISKNNNNMYVDCTDSFRQSSLRSMVNGPSSMQDMQTCNSSRNLTTTSNMSSSYRNVNTNVFKKPQYSGTLKDRFQNGFLLPSQRFNKSVAASTISEKPENNNNPNRNNQMRNMCETDSDQEDMFSQAPLCETGPQMTKNQKKRGNDNEVDNCLPLQKRFKVASPPKPSVEITNTRSQKILTSGGKDTTNDFIFTKPAIVPARKSVKEKLISKSAAPLSDTIINASKTALPLHEDKEITQPQTNPSENTNGNKPDEINEDTTQNLTETSMRPSFIKRKLFTQKLDVTENKKINNLGDNSPQNSVYSAIQKEKHKARRLVTNQSCLSRDVQQDDNNLLDLIHKIVPANSMNITNQTNKTDIQNKNKTDSSDKWDVTSIISTKNQEDMSDTYTDDEIFNATIKANENPAPIENITNAKKCTVLLEKIPNVMIAHAEKSNDKRNIKNCIKKFWDNDSESDIDCIPNTKNNFRDNMMRVSDTEKDDHSKASSKIQGISNKFNSKKSTLSTTLNKTVSFIQNLNGKTLKIKSHRSPKVKESIEVKGKTIKSFFETQSKKQNQSIVYDDLANRKEIVESQNKKTEKETLKHVTTAKKSDKQTPNKESQNKKSKPKKDEINKKANNSSTQKPKNKSPKNSKNKQSATLEKKTKEPEKNKDPQNTKKQNKPSQTPQTKKPNKEQKKPDVNKKTDKKPTDKKSNSKVMKENKVTTLKNGKNISPKGSKTKSVLLNDTSDNNKSLSGRAIRSCRINNRSLDVLKINQSINSSMNRTLRSRNIDLSSTFNKYRC